MTNTSEQEKQLVGRLKRLSLHNLNRDRSSQPGVKPRLYMPSNPGSIGHVINSFADLGNAINSFADLGNAINSFGLDFRSCHSCGGKIESYKPSVTLCQPCLNLQQRINVTYSESLRDPFRIWIDEAKIIPGEYDIILEANND